MATNQNVMRFDDGPLTYIDGMLCIDGMPLDRIAAETGTPAYVYSADAVTSRYQRTADAFAPLGGHVHYAVKANGNLGLLRLLARLGSGFEVVSGGELTRVLRAGGDAAKVVFSGVGKTRAELMFAVEQGALLLVESADELDALQAVAAAGTRARFALRVNPDVTVDTHHHIQTGHDAAKFGVPVALARELLERAAAGAYPDLDAAGVHIHVGSQLPDPSGMSEAAGIALELLRGGRDAGLDLDVLNVGGGFPVAYDGGDAPDPQVFARALEPVVAGAGVELGVEPGRSLVARAGVLVAQVLYRKHRAAGRMLVLDTGMHHLLRPALYEAAHRFKPLRAGEPPAGPTELVGQICESTDVLGVTDDLPDLEPGDLVAILDAGAYGMTMASNYNSHPRPPEILVEHGVARVTRRRETWDDLLDAERHANSVGTVLPSRAIRQRLRVDHTAEFQAIDLTGEGSVKH